MRPRSAANRIQQVIEEAGYFLLDGGLATEMERLGFNLDTDLWSAAALTAQPDLVSAVHEKYLSAGSRCVTSASYQVSVNGFERAGYSAQQAWDSLQLSIDLALDARDKIAPEALVAASLGPFGASRADGSEYTGNYGLSRAELLDFHSERFRRLAHSGADFLACETIPSLYEAEALAELFTREPAVEGWVSFSCVDDRHLSDGTAIAEGASLFAEVGGVFAVGINCVAPELVENLIRELRAAVPDKHVVVYPNAGGTYDAASKEWTAATQWDCVAAAARWYEAGARLLGGCCRVGPGQIEEIGRGLA